MKIWVKIALGSLLTYVIAGLFFLYVVNRLVTKELETYISTNSKLSARQAMDSVDRIIYRRLEEWQEYFNNDQLIRESIKNSNNEFSKNPHYVEYIENEDLKWAKDNFLSNQVIQNNLSKTLMHKTQDYSKKYGYNIFPEVIVTNKYGAVVSATGKTTDYNQADEEWWQKSRDSGVYVSNYMLDESTGNNSIEVCSKIVDTDGNFIGVGKTVYNIKDIVDIIQEVKTSQNYNSTNVFLIDGQGTTIFPDSSQKIPDLEKILKNNAGFYTFNTPENTTVLAHAVQSSGYKDFKGLGWSVLVEYKQNDILEPLYFITRRISIVLAVSFVISSILALIISRFITNPIEKLKKGMEIIEKGNLNFKTEINSKDEIGQLSKSFDKMVSTVREERKKVDEKVELQTREIVKKSEDLQAQQAAILNILEDVEEEKIKSQQVAINLEKFKLAVDNTAEHVVITDANGIVLYANKAVTDITGFSANEVLGKKAGSKELWGGNMSKEIYESFWDIIKNKKKSFNGEFNNTRKNGENYVAEAIVTPIVGDNGEVTFLVGIERDITKAKEVDRMKTEFISLASHQLRTPLSAMKWFSEMLLAGDAGTLNKNQIEFIQNIYDSNERMVALVNSLLNISRIESGRMIVDPQPTDIKILVESVIKELEVKIKEKNQKVIVSVNSNMKNVCIDPKLIREVYKNLLTNAIKYTPNNGEITVIVSQNGTEIVSQISDTGYGIPEQDKGKVFGKFYRASNITKIESEGTGLGLYLVKAIIESSNGKIWYESKENYGTSFWFTLPLGGMEAKSGEVSTDS